LQNVVEQLASMVRDRPIEVADLQAILTDLAPGPTNDARDRRRSIVDELFDGLSDGSMNFWDDVHRLFIERDLTREHLRRLIQMGLAASSGSYRGLLHRFGISQQDYKALLNFLGAHDCRVDSREFRLRARTAATTRRRHSPLSLGSRSGCSQPDETFVDSEVMTRAGSALRTSQR
jgi:hypothetical protein